MENKLSITRELLEPCRWIDRRETPFVLSDLATVFPAIGADDLQDLLERLAAVGFVRPVLD